MPVKSKKEEVQENEEMAQVHTWRFSRFREMLEKIGGADHGEAAALAADLAASPADLHRAAAILKSGCPPELLVQILT